jgi:hypothetical protein
MHYRKCTTSRHTRCLLALVDCSTGNVCQYSQLLRVQHYRTTAVLVTSDSTRNCYEYNPTVHPYSPNSRLTLFFHIISHFAQSIFCWEEVICAQPQLAKHHRHIAEVYYTAGGVDNLTTARKYYAAALDMSTASDLRAMYGLVLVDKKLKDFEQKKNGIGNGKKSLGDASNVAQGDVGADLGKDAAAFIPKIYKVACPGLLPVVQKQLAMAV